ncbi:MAG: MscL family protein [Desulfosporosinus sp.]|nr:MscL family protein [Desulfosporosinus sp.]
MSFIKEFKEFATRGNVMELAVGIISFRIKVHCQ